MRTRLAAPVLILALSTSCAETGPTPPAGSGAPTSSPTVTNPDRVTGEPTQPPSQPPSRATVESPRAGQKIVSAASDVGTVLFDQTGQAIYLFAIETTTRPRCYGPCARAWPPVLTDGRPVAGKQVNAALLGTTARRDGTTQVTYDGHPLYFYAHEGKYEVECHDIFLHGGRWYAVQPNGRRAP